MSSRTAIGQPYNILKLPQPIRDTRRHSWLHPQGLMDTDEVIVNDVDRDGTGVFCAENTPNRSASHVVSDPRERLCWSITLLGWV